MTTPDPPPELFVSLQWAAASRLLDKLRAATGAELTALCATATAAFRTGMVAEGGPPGDTTVTEALLVELAAWLRALDTPVYAALTSDMLTKVDNTHEPSRKDPETRS